MNIFSMFLHEIEKGTGKFFFISDSYHANFDLVFDTSSDVVNQGGDTIFGEGKIMIGVCCMIMNNMAQSPEK